MKKTIYPILFAATLLLAGACSNDDTQGTEQPIPTPYYPLELSTAERQIAQSNNEFAVRLFSEVAKSEQGENLFISPLSASYALAMLTNGANGNTLDELKMALGFADASLEEMNAFYRKLTDYLKNADGQSQFGIANSIWLNKGFEALPAFIATNHDVYSAEVRSLDFSDSDALRTINGWVSDKTYGHIPNLLDKISTDAMTYLINALYFKGVWKDKFEEISSTFTNGDGRQTSVKSLTDTRNFAYTEDDDVQMAAINYGNGSFSLAIILPKENRTPQEVASALTPTKWEEWTSRLNGAELKMEFPTFSMNYGRALIDDLKALGINDAFSPLAADFSKLSNSPIFVGLVQQKSYIEVTKEGTVAAAATVIGGYTTSLPPTTGPINFIVDRPFLFAIKENSTNTILFMGSVVNL
ncbi:MAG: serpin family protein [Mediterranea sp.]|jgi:serpin B|nr:serpin family protein [Mediterranea sp.]